MQFGHILQSQQKTSAELWSWCHTIFLLSETNNNRFAFRASRETEQKELSVEEECYLIPAGCVFRRSHFSGRREEGK